MINCSTVGPAVASATACECRTRGIGYADAPVLGSTGPAKDGTLTVLVGGSGADVTRAQVVLDHLGRTIIHAGDVGSASALKLVMNLLIGGQTALMAEAFLLADRAGLAKQILRDTLHGSVLDSPFVRYKAPQLLDRNFAPLFTTALLLKDIDLALDLAHSYAQPLPATRAVRDTYAASMLAGRRDDDFSAVIATLDDARHSPSFPECVTFEVAARVEPALTGQFEAFMTETHLPAVEHTGCFLHTRLERSSAGAYRVMHYAVSRHDVETYLAQHAPTLRARFEARFPAGVLLTRTIWEDQARLP